MHLPGWRVLLCTLCVQPRPEVWVAHLRQHPHSLRRAQLKGLAELFGSYDLAAPSGIGVPGEGGDGRPIAAIEGLRVADGWQCCTCTAGLTRNLKAMKLHVSKAHQQRPSLHHACKCFQVKPETMSVGEEDDDEEDDDEEDDHEEDDDEEDDDEEDDDEEDDDEEDDDEEDDDEDEDYEEFGESDSDDFDESEYFESLYEMF